jgi:hypothetical protein
MPILRSLKLAAGLVLICAVPATATTALPTVQRTLSVSHVSRSCSAAATDTTSYTAPMAGFVSFRLDGAGGQWNLFTADARSRRATGSSRAFGAHQVVQAWASAGQRFLITACRAGGSVSTAALSIELVDAAKPAPQVSSIVRTTTPLSRGKMAKLTSLGFDFDEAPAPYLFVPSAAKLAALKRLGVGYKVTTADVQAYDAKARAHENRLAAAGLSSNLPSGRETYRYLSEIQAEMADIVAKHPDIARPVTIGNTYQGRPIQGVEFSDNVKATDDGKPVFFLMGTHHAREWPAAEIAMEFMTLLAKENGQSDADGLHITDLLKKERILVVPVINVDGYFASRGDWAGRTASGSAIPDPEDATDNSDTAEAIVAGGALAYRRKNCDTVSQAMPSQSDAVTQSLPCYFQVGVDPNRNYGFDWGGPGASSDPTTQTYRGTGQWSEPETQAVWHYSQTHPVTTLITLHTVAALVLRSPGLHTHGLAPDETLLKQLGNKMAGNTGYTSEYGWQLYDTTGTTEDWNYGAVGTLGYTIELGDNGGTHFHDAYDIGVVDQWTGSKVKIGGKTPDGTKITGGGMHSALLTAADYAADPKTHATLTGTGTPGATLEVKKTFVTDSSPICTVGDPVILDACESPGAVFGTTHAADVLDYKTTVRPDGTFAWHVTQSTRPFVGYKYDTGTKLPAPTGTQEQWTLTCSVGGATVATQKLFVERGQALALGNVCAG